MPLSVIFYIEYNVLPMDFRAIFIAACQDFFHCYDIRYILYPFFYRIIVYYFVDLIVGIRDDSNPITACGRVVPCVGNGPRDNAGFEVTCVDIGHMRGLTVNVVFII